MPRIWIADPQIPLTPQLMSHLTFVRRDVAQLQVAAQTKARTEPLKRMLAVLVDAINAVIRNTNGVKAEVGVRP
jgi:hypothetical protein